MYGLPAYHATSQAVAELCQPHHHRAGLNVGTELPLLIALQRAVGSSMGRGSTSGGERAGSPANLQALALLDGITAMVTSFTPTLKHMALIPRVEEWATSVVISDDVQREAILLELVREWAQAIRDLLDPPVRVPLRGVTCPQCNCTHVEQADEEGIASYNAAILVHLTETPVRGECLVCATQWHGGELLDLKAAISV